MKLKEYEGILIKFLFIQADKNILAQICFEVIPDCFEDKTNRAIYVAIQQVIKGGDKLDIPSVILHCKEKGIEPYLTNLIKTYPDTSNIKSLVRILDTAARVRKLKEVLDHYQGEMNNDFDKLIFDIEKEQDIDTYLTNVLQDLTNALHNKIEIGYQHTSELFYQELEMIKLAREGIITDTIPTGLPQFESYSIPRPGTFGILAGLSSRGKTALGLLLAEGVGLKIEGSGYVALNELESKKGTIYRRLGCMLSNVEYSKITQGNLSPKEERNYIQALQLLNSLPIYLDDTPDLTIEKIKTQSLLLSLTKGQRVFGIIDYSELLGDKGGYNEEGRLSSIATKVHSMSRKLGSCDMLVSQYSTSILDTATMLGGSKTRQSSSLYHKADWFIELYNLPEMLNKGDAVKPPSEYDPNFAWAIVRKNKEYPTGNIKLEWYNQFTLFRDANIQKSGAIFNR